jgi:hypothetical protein
VRNATPSLVLALALPLFSEETTTEHSESSRIENGEPVLEYWDGGIFQAGVKPFPIMVVWPDGSVIKRVNDRLLMGTISKDSV